MRVRGYGPNPSGLPHRMNCWRARYTETINHYER